MMTRISNFGAKHTPDSCEELLYNDIHESSIDYIFVLNKQKAPSKLKLINEQELPYDITFDDRLPKTFFELYKEKSRAKFFSPIYELGTKCEPRRSKKLIESVLMVNK
jgi:hypothetical protein